jgi:hypothetical protein
METSADILPLSMSTSPSYSFPSSSALLRDIESWCSAHITPFTRFSLRFLFILVLVGFAASVWSCARSAVGSNNKRVTKKARWEDVDVLRNQGEGGATQEEKKGLGEKTGKRRVRWNEEDRGPDVEDTCVAM